MISAIAANEDMKAMNEMLMAKLFSTNTMQMVSKIAIDLVDSEALREPSGDDVVMGVRDYSNARWVSQYFMSLSTAIAGGSSNIQRNIIGERLLGLPRDQRGS